MTNIVRAQVIQLLTAIRAGDFDENTIRSLYMHLRELARLPRPNSITLDIGDFFAHPGRNRGLLQRHVDKTVKALDAYTGVGKPKPKIKLIPHSRVFGDLDVELGHLKLPPLSPNHDLALVLFAAFQGTSVTAYDKRKIPLGFYVRPNEVGVCAGFTPKVRDSKPMLFPVISLPIVHGLPEISPNLFDEGWPLIRVAFRKGVLDLFQTFEFIERDMNPRQFAYPGVPYKVPVNLVPESTKSPKE